MGGRNGGGGAMGWGVCVCGLGGWVAPGLRLGARRLTLDLWNKKSGGGGLCGPRRREPVCRVHGVGGWACWGACGLVDSGPGGLGGVGGWAGGGEDTSAQAVSLLSQHLSSL